MRPSKFSEEEMIQALNDVKAGMPTVQLCRSLGITHTTFYRWRSRFDDVALGELRELRELREENLQLKQLVADLLLEKRTGPVARKKTK